MLHVLRGLSQGREGIVIETATATATEVLDDETHRRLAKDLYNHAGRSSRRPTARPPRSTR